jgi:hypothetical protein
MPFVPVPRRNPETSRCEVRKSVRDSFGAPRTLEVVAVAKGVARAQAAIDDFTKHLTEEEKKSGIFFCWECTSRRIGGEPWNIADGQVHVIEFQHLILSMT